MSYDKEKFAEYPLKGIPRRLWQRVREATKEQGMNMRTFLLKAIEEKLDNDEKRG